MGRSRRRTSSSIPPGKFKTLETASVHLEQGAKKVVITAPSSDAPMIVMGVNEDTYDPIYERRLQRQLHTNCLAPVTKVIHDNFTHRRRHHDHRSLPSPTTRKTSTLVTKTHVAARGCTQSIIHNDHRCCQSHGHKIIPELNGKMNGFALRVPTPNVSPDRRRLPDQGRFHR